MTQHNQADQRQQSKNSGQKIQDKNKKLHSLAKIQSITAKKPEETTCG